MDSSPDLSLKLRRGSNDSRDSYYMDFAQGIDSDIEEVATVATAPGNIDVASDSSDSQAQVVVTLPAPMPVQEEVSDEKNEPKLPIDEELPPAPSSPPPPPPALDTIPPPILDTIPIVPTGSTLDTSAITNLTDASTTDEEDISQITPLPMPILPSLKTDILQMMPPNIPLVDDEEG